MLTRSYLPQGKNIEVWKVHIGLYKPSVVQQRVSHPVEKGQVLECTPYDFEELHEGIIMRFITRDEPVVQA